MLLSTRKPSRLSSAIKQFGWKEGIAYLLAAALSRATGGKARLIRYHLVAQPVPAEAATRPPPPTGRSKTRFIEANDAIVSQFPRPERVIARRFAQGDRCLVSQTDERFTGYIWLARNSYDEDTVRCLYVLERPEESAWDYDVYVDPDFRMGRTFSRLWSAANHQLAAEGVRWSYSRIATANPQSIDSHRRLGIRHLYSASFLVIGQWQLMLAGAAPFIHLSTSSAAAPSLKLSPPLTQNEA